MATYTVQAADRAGVVPTQNAVAASDQFPNDGHTMLWIENGSGSPLTVTIVTPGTIDGQAVSDRDVTIADGAIKVIGPFPRNVYNDSDGLVTVEFDETTSVTAAAISV